MHNPTGSIVSHRDSSQTEDVPFQIVVKEIGIQQRLNHPTNVYNPVMLVVGLRVGSVDPVENVQGSVGTHEKDVVSGQVLHLAVALQDNQLGHDGNALQQNTKSPQEFHHRKVGNSRSDEMNEKGQDTTGGRRKLPMQKGILSLFVGALDWFLEFDGVNDRRSRSNVNQFHNRVVERVKCRKEIQIPSHENRQIELVGFDGNTCRINKISKTQNKKGYISPSHKSPKWKPPLFQSLGPLPSAREHQRRTLGIFRYSESKQQNDDAEQMRHVAAKPKDIHFDSLLSFFEFPMIN